jgi:hypothetical protein
MGSRSEPKKHGGKSGGFPPLRFDRSKELVERAQGRRRSISAKRSAEGWNA